MVWSDFSGRDFNAATIGKRIDELQWGKTAFSLKPLVPVPVGITLHNTAAPTLAQWAESGPNHDARIKNLERYYDNELHWMGGPHWFVGRENITEFSNPLRRGTHSPSFNKDHLGIEMVGDYNREEFNSGDGAKVRDNAVLLMALLCRKFGWDPAAVIKLHKEDPRTDHDCPGRKVDKMYVIHLVQEKMIDLDEGVDTPPAPAPEPVPLPPAPPVSADLRRRMGAAILGYEARRDNKGRLSVYALPSGDEGGTYEVAGINDGFHPTEARLLRNMIAQGKYDEAEKYASEYMMQYTDLPWLPSEPSCQFFLRDCAFNRGPGGAARILQRALGVPDDGKVGPITKAALDKAIADPAALLVKLRAAREQYEREVKHRSEGNKFWDGLVNRWNNAARDARGFAAEPARAPMMARAGLVTPQPETEPTRPAMVQNDSTWMLLRYAIMAAGGAMALRGWLPAEMVGPTADAIMAAVGPVTLVVGTLWGLVVTWRTKRVPAEIAASPNIPTVSPVTGAVEPTNKFTFAHLNGR